MKVAVIATHPIQYQVPWFQELHRESNLEVRVLFAMLLNAEEQGRGFGVAFDWDIPMLEGYAWEVLAERDRGLSFGSAFLGKDLGIRNALVRYRPDAAIIMGWHTPFMLRALLECMRLGIPRLVRGDSNNLRKRPLWKRIAQYALLSRFDAFLAVGQANRDFYLDYGIPESRIFFCPHFVDNTRFQWQLKATGPRNELRQHWGIRAEDVCFVYAGKLEPKKRIMDLLEALRHVGEVDSHVYLLVVGSGELQRAAEAYVRRHKLPVTFTGFLNQTEITRAYAAADCLVLPSDYGETWGLVVNEAMTCGLPVIVSDRVGCAPDLVQNGVTGFIVPFGDGKRLAEQMMVLVKDRLGRESMGTNAKARVNLYSVGQAVRGTLDALTFVMSDRSSVGAQKSLF